MRCLTDTVRKAGSSAAWAIKWVLACLVLITATGCPFLDPFFDVYMVPTEVTIEVGQTTQLRATDLMGRDFAVAYWLSDSDEIASVNGSGMVTGVSPGVTNVWVHVGLVDDAYGDNQASCSVTVIESGGEGEGEGEGEGGEGEGEGGEGEGEGEQSKLDKLADLLILLGGMEFAEAVLEGTFGLPVGVARPNSNQDLDEHVPEDSTEICAKVDIILELSLGDLSTLFGIPYDLKLGGTFPCGQGADTRRVCSIYYDEPTTGGQWLFVSQVLEADVVLDDPVNSYQYGFVFDGDNITDNNYVPIPIYANDYYQDTDRWYSVEYTPEEYWELKVRDARTGKALLVYTGATALISGNAILLAVPMSEFDVADPGYRLTAFRHSGDWGQNPPYDWSADFHPELGEPLYTANTVYQAP